MKSTGHRWGRCVRLKSRESPDSFTPERDPTLYPGTDESSLTPTTLAGGVPRPSPFVDRRP